MHIFYSITFYISAILCAHVTIVSLNVHTFPGNQVLTDALRARHLDLIRRWAWAARRSQWCSLKASALSSHTTMKPCLIDADKISTCRPGPTLNIWMSLKPCKHIKNKAATSSILVKKTMHLEMWSHCRKWGPSHEAPVRPARGWRRMSRRNVGTASFHPSWPQEINSIVYNI